jgi:hypothetical protein
MKWRLIKMAHFVVLRSLCSYIFFSVLFNRYKALAIPVTGRGGSSILQEIVSHTAVQSSAFALAALYFQEESR